MNEIKGCLKNILKYFFMNILNYLCHRKPERSFFIKGHQFPVCARCTGFYTTLILFLIINCFYTLHYTFESFLIGIILIIPCAIDGITQYFGYRESNNTLRFITGLIAGAGLILIIEYILYSIFAIIGFL